MSQIPFNPNKTMSEKTRDRIIDIAALDALDDLAQMIYENAKAKGFHDKPEGEIEYLARHTANVHGEVSELWEAARRSNLRGPCDKPVPLTCEEEETADIIIRCLDYAARRGFSIGRAVQLKHDYNTMREHKHGGKLA